MKALVYHGPGQRGWDIRTGRLDPSLFATHRFPLDRIMDAYDTFADAANTGALKVVVYGPNSTTVGSDVMAEALTV